MIFQKIIDETENTSFTLKKYRPSRKVTEGRHCKAQRGDIRMNAERRAGEKLERHRLGGGSIEKLEPWDE